MPFLSRLWARLMQWLRPTPPNRATPEPHALDSACERFSARYERSVFPTGEVQVMLIRNDATLSAVGKTTKDAVNAVTAKANACWGGLT